MESSFDRVRNIAKSIAEVSKLVSAQDSSKPTPKQTDEEQIMSEALSNRDRALIALGVTPKRLRSAILETALSAF
jgi:hypothetical protein